jgi:cell division protein FtsL
VQFYGWQNAVHDIVSRFFIALLMCAVFISAAYVVKIRHHNLILFIELQNLRKERDNLNVEWSKLQLEHSTWAQHSRIEEIANEKFKMFMPDIKDIIVIKAEESPKNLIPK